MCALEVITLRPALTTRQALVLLGLPETATITQVEKTYAAIKEDCMARRRAGDVAATFEIQRMKAAYEVVSAAFDNSQRGKPDQYPDFARLKSTPIAPAKIYAFPVVAVQRREHASADPDKNAEIASAYFPPDRQSDGHLTAADIFEENIKDSWRERVDALRQAWVHYVLTLPRLPGITKAIKEERGLAYTGIKALLPGNVVGRNIRNAELYLQRAGHDKDWRYSLSRTQSIVYKFMDAADHRRYGEIAMNEDNLCLVEGEIRGRQKRVEQALDVLRGKRESLSF